MKFLRQHKVFLAIGLIVILHLVGLVGLIWEETHELVNQLTPVNLCLSALVLFYFHKNWTLRSVLVFVLIGFIGYFSEVIGVNTGLIFGNYRYGSVLGIMAFNVPLVLGLLWLLMIYGSADITRRISDNVFLAAFVGAGLMTFFDWIMEPNAMRLGYWTWENDTVPLQNYLAWFVISFVLHFLFLRFTVKEQNPLAVSTFLVQLLFFILLNVFLP
jgi:putative membrane protein